MVHKEQNNSACYSDQQLNRSGSGDKPRHFHLEINSTYAEHFINKEGHFKALP